MVTHLVQQFGRVTPSLTVCGLARRYVRSQTAHYKHTTCAECLARVVVASDEALDMRKEILAPNGTFPMQEK